MFGSKQRSPALETPPADPLRAGGECGATVDRDGSQRWGCASGEKAQAGESRGQDR